MSPRTPAILVLKDGTVFRGTSIGADGLSAGEVVFNTAMTGYQEILTDPSYARQIVTLTYPHIGNTGANAEDVESGKVYAAGLVIRDLPLRSSNFRESWNLSDYLKRENVVAIADIDTRKLTRILREKGAQEGCIMAGQVDEAAALRAAREFPGLAGMDLAKVVSCEKPYTWNESTWALGKGFGTQTQPKFKVVAYDFGIKWNILRRLEAYGCDVHVFPADADAPLRIEVGDGHVVAIRSYDPADQRSTGEVTQRELVKNCLRMRPDRIIVGEVRGPEALDMLQAMNTGHEGSMSTCHANSPRDALRRLETLALLGDATLPAGFVRDHLGSIDVFDLGDDTTLVSYSTRCEPDALALMIGGATGNALLELKRQMETGAGALERGAA